MDERTSIQVIDYGEVSVMSEVSSAAFVDDFFLFILYN